MPQVYLALGTNLGRRKDNLKEALERLSVKVRILKVSPIYETEPVGYSEQPMFLNLALCGETTLKPAELLAFAKGIEKEMGRAPSFPNAPRPMDIDILFYGDKIMNTAELTIPHPRLTLRAFVMLPLNDIAPELVHPGNKRSVKSLLKDLGALKGLHRWGEAAEIWG